MTTLNRKYNLKPAVTTGTEKMFRLDHHSIDMTITLPLQFDLRTMFPSCIPVILDQSSLGSCAANELSNAMRYCLRKEKVVDFQPSRLYIYYFGRLFEGSDVHQDTGMSVSGVCGAIQKYGSCSENNWGYDITKFTIQPPRHAIIAAHTHVPGYKFLQVQQDLVHIKQALFSGYPIIIGLQLYSSFESDLVMQTGVVPIPDITKETLLGGHCLALYSYDDSTQTFGMMNSWGKGTIENPVGKDGWFTIPYKYILDPNLGQDYCQVRYFK